MFAFVLCILLVSATADLRHAQVCVPGKTPGIFCLTTEQIIERYKPLVESTRDNLRTTSKGFTDRINSMRGLIIRNNMSIKNQTIARANGFRNIIRKAKEEAYGQPVSVQACIRRQEMEFNRILAQGFQMCNSFENMTTLNALRNGAIKLEQVAAGTILHCKSLNPLRTEAKSLQMCIEKTIKDINIQTQLMERVFEEVSTEIMRTNFECNMRKSNSIFQNIERIFNGMKQCRFPGYRSY